MSRSRDPYGVAVETLIHLADSGRFAPGEALVVTELAEAAGLSATPMREALARLAGEGLIDRKRGRGYFYPILSIPEIIDLYEVQRAYVHAALALHSRGPAVLQKAAAGLDPDQGPGPLLDAIVAQSHNDALAAAHRRVSRRLAVAGRLERELELAPRALVAGMVRSALEGRIDTLQRDLGVLHERRCAQAWRLGPRMAEARAAKQPSPPRGPAGGAPGPSSDCRP